MPSNHYLSSLIAMHGVNTYRGIYFLRRWLTAGKEAGDEDGGDADGEEETDSAVNLFFLRNSQ